MNRPTPAPLKPIKLPELKPIGTESVSKKQSLQEWHAAGGGVPLQYKGREHVWHAKVKKFAEGGEVQMKKGGDSRGEMRATPRNKALGAAADAAKWLHRAASEPFGYANPPGEMLSELIGVPAVGRTLEKLAYGEPITNYGKANVPLMQDDTLDAAMTIAPMVGPTARMAAKGAKAAGRGALDLAKSDAAYNLAQRALASPAMAAVRPMNVVKPTGGNFLTGRTEKDLSSLKRGVVNEEAARRLMGDAFTNERMADPVNNALNKWVDSNLTNYVKKQMATPDDPVRKLAEEGISHKPTILEDLYDHPAISKKLKNERIEAGFPEAGMGNSPTARAWERVSDKAIATHRAGDIQNMPEQYAKFQEAERKIRAAREAVERKFRQQMENAGVDGTNNMHFATSLDEKAKIVGDTDLAKANAEYKSLHSPMMESYIRLGKENPWISKVDPETPVYTSFTNDLGFDHIMDVLREDLTAGRIRPEQMSKISMSDAVRRTYQYDQELAAKMNASRAAAREGLPTYKEYPEGYRWVELNKPGAFANESEAMGHSVRGYEPPKGHPDWAEGSGDSGSSSYGHGGWEAIKSGKAKVYSLVDSKGAPHATVEVGASRTLTPEKRAAQMESLMHRLRGEGMSEEAAMRQAEKLYPESETFSRISQIKGKQNRAPNEEYLPYIQDFVKSGKWSDVGDFSNTGLVRLKDLEMKIHPEIMKRAREKYGDYATQAEIELLHAPSPDVPMPGMAHGGAIHMAGGGLLKSGLKKLLGATEGVPKVVEPIGKLEEAMKAKQAPMVAPQGTGLPLMPRSQGMYIPGVKQEDLPRMPKVDKARAEGKQPAYTERMQDLLDSPTVRKKVDKLINKGKDLNVQEWYGIEPLRQVAMDAGRTPEQFESLVAQLASASQRNPVDQQNKMGSYLYYLSQTGQLPDDAFLLTNKIKRGKQEMPKGTPIELPSGYGSLAQGDIFGRGKQIASGDIMGALPPDKKLGTFYRNYLGNLKPVTVDVNAVRGPIIERGDPRWLTSKLVEKDEEGKVIATHFPRRDVAEGRMSLKEAKDRPGFWEAAPSGSEYAGFEDLWQRGARRHDMEPAEAQALGWYGSADVTALKTKPELYIDNLERMIKRTAEQTGQHPLQVMEDIVRGKGFLYKKGGAVHLPDKKPETFKPIIVGKKPQHKRGGLPSIKRAPYGNPISN